MIIVYMVCKPKTKSLRFSIGHDDDCLKEYGLRLGRQQKPGRKPGWTELTGGPGTHGAIKIEWDGDTRVLTCRVVTRAAGNPSEIIAKFTHYMLDNYRRYIASIHSVLR